MWIFFIKTPIFFGIQIAINNTEKNLKRKVIKMIHSNTEITKSSKFEISSIVVIACLIAVLFVGFIV
jgi:hypothetical protein